MENAAQWIGSRIRGNGLNGLVRSLPVGSRLIMIYVFGIFLPLALANGLVLHSVLLDAGRQEKWYLQELVDNTAHEIVREFEPVLFASEFVYADSRIYRLLAARYERFEDFIVVHREQLIPSLLKYVSVFPSIARAVVYTDNPIVGVAEGFLHINDHVLASAWYEIVSDSSSGLVAMVHVEADPRQVIGEQTYLSVFRRLDNPALIRSARSRNLILRIDVNPTVLHRVISSSGLNGEFEIVDGFGTVFAAYRTGSIHGAGYHFEKSIMDAGALLDGWRMRGRISTLRPVFVWSTRWTLLLTVSGLSVALSSLFIMMLSRSVTRRLHSLSRQMRKVEQEDFSPLEFSDGGQDEIGRLIEDFNLMSNKIGALINDGYKLELEQHRLLVARKQAELDALQSQVNPHFLFNVLESIRMRSHIKGEHETAAVIKKLSNAFRRIASWDHDLVPIELEIAFVREYLDIQQYRFGNRLRAEIEIDPAVADLLVPKTTVQCLVENACVHGIERNKNGGCVRVSVFHDRETAVIRVQDDGAGCDAAAVRARLREDCCGSKHIGVTNVWRRLQLHYGENFRFDFDSRAGEGTTVTIRISV